MNRPVDEGQLFGRGIAFPPRIGPQGRMMWSEGPQNIVESIRIILQTELRERLMRPHFGAGLQTFLFRPNTAATHGLIEDRVTRALARWEPRIRVQSVQVEADPQDPEGAIITIDYQLVATGTQGQATLAVQFVA